jgi:hypothetical protein
MVHMALQVTLLSAWDKGLYDSQDHPAHCYKKGKCFYDQISEFLSKVVTNHVRGP